MDYGMMVPDAAMDKTAMDTETGDISVALRL